MLHIDNIIITQVANMISFLKLLLFSKAFFNTALENDFIPTITLPKRIVDSSVSLIDHIFY